MTAHRRGVTATGERGGGSGERSAPDSGGREAGGAREAVGTRRLCWDGGTRGEAAVGERAGAARQLSSERGVRGAVGTRGVRGEARSSGARSAGCRDAVPSRQRFNPRCRHGSGALPRGPNAARDG
jgi:hypothetical protein